MMAGQTLLPVTILTGFLGSGKTTLLRRLLARPEFAQCAVLINEIGEVGIDHHLVRDLHENPIVLPNGCLCCTVQGDFIDALRELLFGRGRAGIPRYPRVFVETTGLADPAPIAQLLVRDPYVMQHYRLDGIVTLVDAVFGMRQMDAHRESVKQIAMADRLVLTKTDLVAEADRAALAARLRKLNPAAAIVAAAQGEIAPSAILDVGLAAAARTTQEAIRWIAADHHAPALTMPGRHAQSPATHDDRVRTFVVRLAKPVATSRLLGAIHWICSMLGDRILRLKGLLDIEGESRPMVLHAVHHVIYPLIRLDAWPGDEQRASALVFVVRDMTPDLVLNALADMLGAETLQ